MNKFEMGFGGAAKETSQYEKIKGLQADEHGELYPAKENETPRASRFKKVMCAITAGAMLLSAAPAFAGEKELQLTEKQKIELQIQKLEAQKIPFERKEAEDRRAERTKELNGYLDYFNLDGLEIRQPKVVIRGASEQLGIYLKGEHLSDIYSEGSFTFSRQTLIGDVSKVLEKNGFKVEIKLSKLQINETTKSTVDINPEAQQILEGWGGFIDLNNRIINIGGSGKMIFDMNTKKIDITSKDKDTIIITCEDYDGKKTVVTCVNKKVANVVEIK